MKGFLGTRADLLSDVLILALLIILLALAKGIRLARRRRFVSHRFLMISIFTVLVLYVVVYEANLALLGGIDYLRSSIRVSEASYFSLLVFHVMQSAFALILGGITIGKGEEAFRRSQISGISFTSSHRKIAWLEVAMLAMSVFTGLAVYYLTFIY